MNYKLLFNLINKFSSMAIRNEHILGEFEKLLNKKINWEDLKIFLSNNNIDGVYYCENNDYLTEYIDHYENRIYKTARPKNIEMFNIKESKILHGYGTIPNLYFYNIIKNQDYYLNNITKELSKYYFITQGLLKLFFWLNLNSKEDAIKIEKFIKENKNKIEEISRMSSGKIEFLGKSLGVVFKLNNNMVLKLFTKEDEFSFYEAQVSMYRLHSGKGESEAMIYDVGILGKFDGHTILYYIEELMKPLTSSEDNGFMKKILKFIAFRIMEDDKYKELKKLQYDENSKEHKDIVNKYIDIIINDFNNLSPEKIKSIKQFGEKLNLKEGWLRRYIKDVIINYLTGRGDLHVGNLGVTNYGDLKYFDPSHKDWVGNINRY